MSFTLQFIGLSICFSSHLSVTFIVGLPTLALTN